MLYTLFNVLIFTGRNLITILSEYEKKELTLNPTCRSFKGFNYKLNHYSFADISQIME